MTGNELSADARAVIAATAADLAGENRRVLLHPLPPYNNSVGAGDMMAGRKLLAEVLKDSRSVLIGGSLPEEFTAQLAEKEFIAVQELFETSTTEHADVVFPAASFAEVDGTFTNNSGFVQRVRRAIDPLHQSKPDWMITALIARELGVDFGFGLAATAVFKSIADSVPAYEGLRYPHLKDESRPVQVKHSLVRKRDPQPEIARLRKSVEALPDQAQKNPDTPRVGHKLHRVTTLTGKTPQFHLLASGNPKPENLLVSPLVQFNQDGSPRTESAAATAAVGASDRENMRAE